MTLGELATLTGLPGEALAATVLRYNELVDRGEDDDFKRFGPGRSLQHPSSGPLPPQRIELAPFYAVQFFPLARKSMVGVRIDRSCRVLDRGGRPIPGLYAVGELTGLAGINGKAGLEGTFLGPSIVTGRVAGRAVAADSAGQGKGTAGAGGSPDRTRQESPPAAASPGEAPETCAKCHDVAKLIATPCIGYSHFEKAHRVVLDRRLEPGVTRAWRRSSRTRIASTGSSRSAAASSAISRNDAIRRRDGGGP